MKEPQAPCLFCDDKKVGCHINCEKYNNFKIEHNNWNRTIQIEKNKEQNLRDIEIRRHTK